MLKKHVIYGKDVSVTQQWMTTVVVTLLVVVVNASLRDTVVAWPCLLRWSSSVMVKRKAPKNFWWCSRGFLLLPQTQEPQSLEVSSESNCCCWFLTGGWEPVAMAADLCELNRWYPNNRDWNCPKELFLNRCTSSFALLTFLSLWWVVG